MRRNYKNGRMISLNGGMRRMLTADKYHELEQLDEYEQSLGDYSKGIRYDLQGLQRRNPIQAGSYLGVIYWDGKGRSRARGAIGLSKYNGWLFVNENGLILNKYDASGYKLLGTTPGYYVIDDTVSAVQEYTFNADYIGSHIAALELHKAGVGDEFSRFYWDGTATSTTTNYYTLANVQLYNKGANQLTYLGPTGTVDITEPGWYSIKDLSKGTLESITISSMNGNQDNLQLWVPGLPSTSTQPLLDESKPVVSS